MCRWAAIEEAAKLLLRASIEPRETAFFEAAEGDTAISTDVP